jgi:hypothetical protein
MNIRDVTPGATDTPAILRRRVIRIVAKTLAVLVLDFLLLRIWAPNLINRHQDLALAGSIVCFVLALAATGWLAFQLWTDIGRLIRARRRGARSHIRIVED